MYEMYRLRSPLAPPGRVSLGKAALRWAEPARQAVILNRRPQGARRATFFEGLHALRESGPVSPVGKRSCSDRWYDGGS